MALALDSGFPTSSSQVTTFAGSLTKAVTTPGTNRLLVAVFTCVNNGGSNIGAPGTVSGGGLTWTKRASAYFASGTGAGAILSEVWTAPCPSVITSQTITASVPATPAQPNTGALTIYCYSGADLTSIGATGSKSDNTGSATAENTSVTATASGSAIVGGIISPFGAQSTLASGNTQDLNVAGSGNGTAHVHLTAATTSGTPYTIGYTGTQAYVTVAALEILASAGGNTMDVAATAPVATSAASLASTDSLAIVATAPVATSSAALASKNTATIAATAPVPTSAAALASTDSFAIGATAAVLVSRWKLDETTGTTLVDSVGGRNATLSGSYTLGASPAPTMFANPGAVSSLAAGLGNASGAGLPSLDAPFSISAWVNFSSVTAPQVVFRLQGASNNGISFVLRASTTLRPEKNSGSFVALTTDFAPSTSTWYHLCYTWDGTTNAYYVNGSVVGTSTIVHDSGSAAGAVANVYVSNNSAASAGLRGTQDDIRIYSGALTPSEVAALAAGYEDAGVVAPVATSAATLLVVQNTVAIAAVAPAPTSSASLASTDKMGVAATAPVPTSSASLASTNRLSVAATAPVATSAASLHVGKDATMAIAAVAPVATSLAILAVPALRPPFVAVLDDYSTSVVPGLQQLTVQVDDQSSTVVGDT